MGNEIKHLDKKGKPIGTEAVQAWLQTTAMCSSATWITWRLDCDSSADRKKLECAWQGQSTTKVLEHLQFDACQSGYHAKRLLRAT